MIVKKESVSYKNIGEFAYNVLKDNIISLNLQPGRKISETEIAHYLGISRTPVREAAIRLVQEGMLYVLPQRGTFVAKIDLSLVEESRFMRRTLEEKVVFHILESFSHKNESDCMSVLQQHKLVSKENYEEHFYYDELFHRILYTSAGKGRIWDLINSFSWDYRRVRYLALVDLVKVNSIIEDHEIILDAIVRKDQSKALEATCAHLDRWLSEQISISTHHPEYFDSSQKEKLFLLGAKHV